MWTNQTNQIDSSVAFIIPSGPGDWGRAYTAVPSDGDACYEPTNNPLLDTEAILTFYCENAWYSNFAMHANCMKKQVANHKTDLWSIPDKIYARNICVVRDYWKIELFSLFTCCFCSNNRAKLKKKGYWKKKGYSLPLYFCHGWSLFVATVWPKQMRERERGCYFPKKDIQNTKLFKIYTVENWVRNLQNFIVLLDEDMHNTFNCIQ
jgi:hypothetical protein